MKKTILTIIVFITSLTSLCCAYMEDKVFCTLWKNSITVTLEKEHNYKCSEYISILSQAINTEYNDVLSIQKLINQWYDVDFWKAIREEKRAKVRKMISIKEEIEKAVAEFDTNLFTKMKEYIMYTTSSYRITCKKLLKWLKNIESQWWKISNSVRKKMGYLQEEIDAIDNIINATDYDTLTKNFNRHLYLKNQIEWK